MSLPEGPIRKFLWYPSRFASWELPIGGRPTILGGTVHNLIEIRPRGEQGFGWSFPLTNNMIEAIRKVYIQKLSSLGFLQ